MWLFLKIDFSNFIAFFTGFFLGAVFLVLIYLLISLITLNKKEKTINKIPEEEQEKIINELISKKQTEFLNLKKSEPIFFALKTSIIDLVNEIAGVFYPNEKYPLAELSMNELILLDKYIINKIESILSKKSLKVLKKIRLSTILKLIDANEKVQNNKAIKASKKLHIPKIYKYLNLFINAINPFYWFKRLIVSPSLSLLIKKIFLMVISITGKETYNVYSKKVFISEDEEYELLDNMLKSNEDVAKIKVKEKINS